MANFNKNTQTFGPHGHDKTIFEVPMIATKDGQVVTHENPFPVTMSASATSTGSDAFGRTRTSNPLTLFDSSHRYVDNDKWHESTSGTASSAHNADEGLIDLTIDTASGDEIIRESKRVMAYQPGKSLLIMTTFVFAPAQENLRQRVGYFGTENGIFLEQTDSTLSIVKRSSISGSVVDTEIAQDSWSYDSLDGTGPSGETLDSSKAQIFWMDLEWLGVGSVRSGFVIDGKFVVAHVFHHANEVAGTYMTTASLPLRQELTNTGITVSASTAKQICSTVISEGGYQLSGEQSAINTPITAAKALADKGVYYPVAAIRLKASPDRLDAIVILSNISLVGVGNGINFHWRLRQGGTVTTASWTSAGTDSSVEYTLIGTASSGGNVVACGFFNSSNQSTPTITIPKSDLFKFQLERNSFTGTGEPLVLEVTAATDSEEVFGGMDWEEISR